MCGLAAIFSYGPRGVPVNREELMRIRESMISRGPDGSGLWLSKNNRVGLAHRRLAIIDLNDSASQPMSDIGNRISLVFNGEIYNFKELRAKLEAKGYKFRTNSDTEVLLHLYLEYGRDMVRHLRGMYAFVFGIN